MADPPPPERPSRLRHLLQEHPEAHGRISRAVAGLLGASVVAIGAFGALIVWHLVRRGRLIRESLGPPRVVRLPDPEDDGPRIRQTGVDR